MDEHLCRYAYHNWYFNVFVSYAFSKINDADVDFADALIFLRSFVDVVISHRSYWDWIIHNISYSSYVVSYLGQHERV